MKKRKQKPKKKQDKEYIIDLKAIEIQLTFLLNFQLPFLHAITRTKRNLYLEQQFPNYPKEMNYEVCKITHDVLSAILQGLSRLSIYLDDYKTDKDIPYFIENLKSHVKNILSYVNLAGYSILEDSQLRFQYYSMAFELTRLLGLIEVLKEKPEIATIKELNEKSIDFNYKFIRIVSFINHITQNNIQQLESWKLGRITAKKFYKFIFYMIKNLCSYYFLIRSSNYAIKELITSNIIQTIFFIEQLRTPINFDIGEVFINPRDFAGRFSEFINSLRELIGYLEVFFQNFNHFKPKPMENEIIELYISPTCKMCKVFFENKLFDYLQEVSMNLNVGLIVYNSDKDILAKARRFFYNIQFVPTIKYPTLENNYKAIDIFVFKDKEEENKVTNFNVKEACKTAVNEINTYLFGAYSHVLPKKETRTKENKTKLKTIERMNQIRAIYEESPDLAYSIKEISDKTGINYNTCNYFCKKLIKDGILFTDDPKKLRIKYYKLNYEKFNFKIQSL